MKVRNEKKHSRWHIFLSLLLTACLVAVPFSINGTVAQATEIVEIDIGVDKNCVKAEYFPNGKLLISGVGRVADYTPETAPFKELEVRSVEIRQGVSGLGAYLFYDCSKLTGQLILPDGLVDIGDCAFSGEKAETAPHFSFIKSEFTQSTVIADPAAEKSEEPEEGASEGAGEEPGPDNTENQEPEAPETAGTEETEAEAGAMMDQDAAEKNAQGPDAEEIDPPAEEPAADPAEPPVQAQEPAGEPEESSSSEETSGESSQSGESEPEATEETGSAQEPEESTAPAPEGGVAGSGYELETIREQRLGKEIFFPSEQPTGGLFDCTEENESFRLAMEEAGYEEADRLIPTRLFCGGRWCPIVEIELPEKDGAVVLPEPPAELTGPDGGDLYVYRFTGWTEELDEADVVRKAGTKLETQNRESLYLIASWTAEAAVKISISLVEDMLLFTVPEIEGYKITSYRWQMAQWEGKMPDPELLTFADIPGAQEASYSRKAEKEDLCRAYRCIITVEKTGLLEALVGVFSNEAEELTLPMVTAAEVMAAEESGFQEGAACRAGRWFKSFTSGGNPSIYNYGAVTADFRKIYTPGQTSMSLKLRKRTGKGTFNFPVRTTVIMADISHTPYHYYSYTTTALVSTLNLTDFVSLEDGVTHYTPSVSDSAIQEELLFIADFSQITSNALSHSSEGHSVYLTYSDSSFQYTPFDITDSSGTQFSNLDVESTDSTVTASFEPLYAGDISFSDNELELRLTLKDDQGQVYPFPAQTRFSGITDLRWQGNGTVIGMVPVGTEFTLTVDFSRTDEDTLPAGTYSLYGELFIKPGLHSQSDGGTGIVGRPLGDPFTIRHTAAPAADGLQVVLTEGERIVDASQEGGATLSFTISAEGGDDVTLAVFKKVYDEGESGTFTYQPVAQSGGWSWDVSGSTAEIEIPQDAETGTYRATFTMESGGQALENETVQFNFIVSEFR